MVYMIYIEGMVGVGSGEITHHNTPSSWGSNTLPSCIFTKMDFPQDEIIPMNWIHLYQVGTGISHLGQPHMVYDYQRRDINAGRAAQGYHGEVPSRKLWRGG